MHRNAGRSWCSRSRRRCKPGAWSASWSIVRSPRDRTVEVDFLGGRARLPVGPWQLAHALQVPVILGFGVYHGGNRYTAHFELFAESLRLPRENREAAIIECAQRYAQPPRALRAQRALQLVQFLRLLAAGAPKTMNPLPISAYTVTSALGAGRAAHVRGAACRNHRAATAGLRHQHARLLARRSARFRRAAHG